MLDVRLESDEGYSRKLSFKRSRLRRFTRLSPAVISISHHFSAERMRVEAFIEAQFKHSYGAILQSHYPTLMSVQDLQGNILAAVGFRVASQGYLYLEQYFDQSIETVLASSLDQHIERHKIVETGALASIESGASVFLFIALNTFLNQQGYTHEVATITQQLERYFSMVGMDMRYLGQADATRLDDNGRSWGSYYDTNPRVFCGSISNAQACMQRLLKLEISTVLPDLHSRLHVDLNKVSV